MQYQEVCLDRCGSSFYDDEEYDGQMFVFLEEFECSEFQDHDYMKWLLPDELYQRYLKEME